MNRYLIFLTATLAVCVAGCLGSKEGPKPPSKPPSASTNPYLELNEFIWGKATISLGMTKTQVLTKINNGFEMWLDEKLIINTPDDFKNNSWSLPYGYHGGTAPGCGVLLLNFKDNKLTAISCGPHCR